MDLVNLVFSSSDDSGDDGIERRVYRERVNFQVPNDFQFREKFRMRRAEVETLLERIGHRLVDSNKNMALDPRQQILIGLHWMGNGGYYHGVADMHGVSKSTVCRIVKRFVFAIVDTLFQEVVCWPANSQELAGEFIRKGGFPSVCGCVDGTLIKIDAPTLNEEMFVDRHGNHSLNAMMICGADYSFYSVSARWPGSVHDARVLRNSAVSQRFENGWRPFPGAIILGDSGYPMKDWLITPYNHNVRELAEQRFNQVHKRTRRLVENAFGILKERFPCLNYMRLNPEFAGRVVMACAALHNITTINDFFVNVIYDEDNPNAVQVQPQNANARLQELLNFFR